MPVNGIIATKEDAELFCGSCVALRSLWEHYRTLFEGLQPRRRLQIWATRGGGSADAAARRPGSCS